MNKALVLFLKNPFFEPVKTRLATKVGESKAQAIYLSMLAATVEKAEAIAKKEKADLFAFSSAGDFTGLESLFRVDESNARIKWSLGQQEGGDLGERLTFAICDLLNTDYKNVVILGTDSPDLPHQFIFDLFENLRVSDVVFGPTEDGGYYSIGARKFSPLALQNVNWSSPSTLDESIKACQKRKLSTSTISKWYDVDELQDLQKLRISLTQKTDLTDPEAGLLKLIENVKTF